MKRISINILFLLFNLNSFSQTLFADSAIIKIFDKEHLKGCQVFNKNPQAIKCADTSRIKYSYDFDVKGNISREISSKRQEDTTLTTYTYDNANRLISQMHYSKSWNSGNRDTSMFVFSYNSKGKIVSRFDYTIHFPNEQQNESKLLYFYNKKDLLEKIICLEFFPNKKQFDTTYTEEYRYNTKGQKEREISVAFYDVYAMWRGQGINTFKYDGQGRLIEFGHTSLRGKRNEIQDSQGDYKCYYVYKGDSIKTETTISNSSFCEITTERNHENKIIKVKRNFIQNVKIENKNGIYIPDSLSKTAYTQNQYTTYQYDKFGRINKCITEYNDDDSRGWKVQGQYYYLYVYKDENLAILPEEKYVADEYR